MTAAEIQTELLNALIEAHDWIVADIVGGDHSGSDDPSDYPFLLQMSEAIEKGRAQ